MITAYIIGGILSGISGWRNFAEPGFKDWEKDIIPAVVFAVFWPVIIGYILIDLLYKAGA